MRSRAWKNYNIRVVSGSGQGVNKLTRGEAASCA